MITTEFLFQFHKSNKLHIRDKDNHIYHCHNCDYTSNDDRVAAMNIYELGKWFVSGIEKPQFEIIENSNG